MYYDCKHNVNKNLIGWENFCPYCGAPQAETMTYAEAEQHFKIPEQTIRAAVKNHDLTEIPRKSARIVKNEIEELKNDGRIGRGPTARRMKRQRL
jgi:hypothetical protein